MRRHRVLLLAEAANPEWTSVPLIGWSLSQALGKLADAHLITHVRNRAAIARAGLVEDRDFTAIDNESVASPLWKLGQLVRGGTATGWTTAAAVSSLAYYSFETEVWRRMEQRITARDFDLVHRITPLSPTSQSPIASRLARLNVPFVIGPLNGGLPWLASFADRRHAEHEWLSYLRQLYKLMPAYRSTLRHSAAIIVGSQHTSSELPNWVRDKLVYIPENGVDLKRFSAPRKGGASLPLKVAFVGRLVPYKGADMLLEATSEFLKGGKLELHIIGDGPQRPMLEAVVERLSLKAVTFHGWVPHVEIQTKLKECDVLALPSVREFGGGVVLEAMALGLTPIVADYGGPSELVDDASGIRVKFQNQESLVAGFRKAIATIVRRPELLAKFGAAGRQRVIEKFTWDAKANQIIAIYNAILSGGEVQARIALAAETPKLPIDSNEPAG